MAERICWNFIDEMHEEKKFELVTIVPGVVLGPSLDNTMKSGGKVIRELLQTSRTVGTTHIQIPLVDVRNLAQCLYNGVT